MAMRSFGRGDENDKRTGTPLQRNLLFRTARTWSVNRFHPPKSEDVEDMAPKDIYALPFTEAGARGFSVSRLH